MISLVGVRPSELCLSLIAGASATTRARRKTELESECPFGGPRQATSGGGTAPGMTTVTTSPVPRRGLPELLENSMRCVLLPGIESRCSSAGDKPAGPDRKGPCRVPERAAEPHRVIRWAYQSALSVATSTASRTSETSVPGHASTAGQCRRQSRRAILRDSAGDAEFEHQQRDRNDPQPTPHEPSYNELDEAFSESAGRHARRSQ